jgi:hypothetical protein
MMTTVSSKDLGGKTEVTEWIPVDGSTELELGTFDKGRDSMKGAGLAPRAVRRLPEEGLSHDQDHPHRAGRCTAAVLIYAAMRPDSFRIERSALIKAPPEKIFHHQRLSPMDAWSPWEKIDPARAQLTAAPRAARARLRLGGQQWSIKAWKLRILCRFEDRHQLDFISPFEAHNTAESRSSPARRVRR